jgi:hypothetical protein
MTRKILIILLLDFFLVWVILSFSFYDDFELARALSRSMRNPTQQARVELDRQRNASRIKFWIIMGSVYFVIAGFTVPLVVISERRKSGRRLEQQ